MAQLGFEMRPIPLTKEQKLVGLKPELRSRIDKETKKRLIYMCEDRFGAGTVIVCPKLTTLSEYLSSTAGPLKQDKITTSSLYHMLSVPDFRSSFITAASPAFHRLKFILSPALIMPLLYVP